ncbi:MAG: SAM-dependent methyltransferase [Bacteroidia bacterium]
MQNKKLWFEDWFDSPYYHLLYGNRDQTEAARFIDNLLQYLKPKRESTFLDLACGKGRHALEIANHGYRTTGIDLSENSIAEANMIDDAHLDFHVGDMRHAHFPDRFDYIFNLFTSFGYFDTSDGQKETLNAIHKQLKKKGLVVIDYLNVAKAERDIANTPDRTIAVDDVHFATRKRVSNQFISKEINIFDNGENHTYYEHIWRLSVQDFEKLLNISGFTIQTIFGDYELNSFKPATSERLILVAKK